MSPSNCYRRGHIVSPPPGAILSWSRAQSSVTSHRPLTMTFCICMGHDHSSPGTESQGHRSRSKVRLRFSKNGSAVGLTSILNSAQFALPRDTVLAR